ncbi:MAG: DUF1345 domain-containing protein [Chitinophagaceae bacterium]|nr:MAG: DUF1345 domain-containing protein [Chitinophagaceae bacterium]
MQQINPFGPIAGRCYNCYLAARRTTGKTCRPAGTIMATTKHNLLRRISGLKKLLVCLAFGVLVFFVCHFFGVDLKSRVVLGWDAFCILMVGLSWSLFFTTTPHEVQEIVKAQDDGIEVMFLLVVTAVCVSLFGSLILLGTKGESSFNRTFHALVSISPVLFSWLLLHTIFSIRYAHLYHGHRLKENGGQPGGLSFPTKEQLDYLDFAYFSFVIGMTFQVSDVEVNSSTIRRFVLLHSLISFVFNTVIVALTINTIIDFVK